MVSVRLVAKLQGLLNSNQPSQLHLEAQRNVPRAHLRRHPRLRVYCHLFLLPKCSAPRSQKRPSTAVPQWPAAPSGACAAPAGAEHHAANMSFQVGDAKKIGIGLTSFGLAFTALGVVLLFDKGLLAMGNVLFLSGVCLLIGPTRSVRFFFQKKKMRGSLFFFAGMALVLFGIPIVGIFVEAWGFINLFGDFFPVAISFMRRVPVVGNLLSTPPIKQLADRFAGAGTGLPV